MMTAHLNHLAFAHMHAIPVNSDLDVVLLIGILIVLAVVRAFFDR